MKNISSQEDVNKKQGGNPVTSGSNHVAVSEDYVTATTGRTISKYTAVAYASTETFIALTPFTLFGDFNSIVVSIIAVSIFTLCMMIMLRNPADSTSNESAEEKLVGLINKLPPVPISIILVSMVFLLIYTTLIQ